MDVGLSDLLTCPRCGPMYGLVLLPHEAADRRVRTGVLGCANCRERWPIEGGVADLRVGLALESELASESDPAAESESVPDSDSEGDAASDATTSPAVRLAGLMGLGEAGGTVLVAGAASRHAAALSSLVEDVEVVAVPESGAATVAAGGPGVSPVRVTRVLPFRSGSLRGVALTGGRAALLEEGARLLGGQGRLVIDPAPGDARERLESAGLTVVASEGGVVVAARSS